MEPHPSELSNEYVETAFIGVANAKVLWYLLLPLSTGERKLHETRLQGTSKA